MNFLKRFFSSDKPADNTKLGRNDLCWCDSGLKYKKCHMESDLKKRSGKMADSYATAVSRPRR